MLVLGTDCCCGHYTYQIEFAGHTIFVKLAFKYLMREAKGKCQRLESQVLKYLSVQGAPKFEQWTLIAQMKYWEIEKDVRREGVRSGRDLWRVTQADLAGARHPSNLMAVQARDSCTESVSQSVGQSIKTSLNYINQMSRGVLNREGDWER